jgi:hypothetical protein
VAHSLFRCGSEQGGQRAEEVGLFADGGESLDGGGEVLEEVGFTEVATEVAVGADGLHEALGGTEEEGFAELLKGAAGELGVILEEFFALGAAEVDVGVKKERGEVILGEAEAEALVVDEPGVAFCEHDVLALEVAMDEAAGEAGEGVAKFAKGGLGGAGGVIGKFAMAVGANVVFEEVILLPLIKGFIEGGLELEVIGGGEFGLGDGVDFGDFLEGELVVMAQFRPGGLPVGVEVFVTEVLEPDAEAGGVVVEDGGDVNAEFGEALGGGGELGVV